MNKYLLLIVAFTLSLKAFSQPANDRCSNAVYISLNSSGSGGATSGETVKNATQSLSASKCSGFSSAKANDVWFEFEATHTKHTIAVVPSSGLDAVVEVRKGSSCSGTFVDCIDNGGGEGKYELLTFSATIGDVYFIRVYDYSATGASPTTFTFEIGISGSGSSANANLKVSDILIKDGIGGGNGDKDGIPEAGEEIDLDIELVNSGNSDATGVTGTLTCTDADITITDDYQSWGTIDRGKKDWTKDFDFTISKSIKEKDVVFKLNISSDQGNWTEYITIRIYAGKAGSPELEVINAVFTEFNSSNNDGVINPGELINLDVQVKNIGDVKATNVGVQILSSDSYAKVETGSSTIKDVNENNSQWGTGLRIQVLSTCPEKTITLNVVLKSDEGTWSDVIQFDVVEKDVVAPTVKILSPTKGEVYKVGEVIRISADISGKIKGKEISYSNDYGATWSFLWGISTTNADLSFDWNTENAVPDFYLIRVTVLYEGGSVAKQTGAFTISSVGQQRYSIDLSKWGTSHLFWPFYNPDYKTSDYQYVSEHNKKSAWQQNIKYNYSDDPSSRNNGPPPTSQPSWFYWNSHFESKGFFHHSGDKCFAQDWNVNPKWDGNDCGDLFFSPVNGKIETAYNSCTTSRDNCDEVSCPNTSFGNYFVIRCEHNDETFFFRAGHFNKLAEDRTWQEGEEVRIGDFMGYIGATDAASHVHIDMFRSQNGIYEAPGGIEFKSSLDPSNDEDMCGDMALNFVFDALLPEEGGPSSNRFDVTTSFMLVPNPSSSNFRIVLSNKYVRFEDLEMEILDGMGRVIYSKTFVNSEQIKNTLFSSQELRMNAGMYYVKLSNEKWRSHSRLLIVN